MKSVNGSPWKPTPEAGDSEIHVKVRVPNDSSPVTAPLVGVSFEPQVRRIRTPEHSQENEANVELHWVQSDS